MTWYWILAVLAALLLLLCWTRVGILAVFSAETAKVDVRIGPISVSIFPAREKPHKKENKPPAEPKAAEAPKQAKKKLPKFTLADIRSAVRTLAPPLKRALARTRRSIRVRPLSLSVTVGAADDPAAGAELYGYLHSGVWTAMPVLEQLLVVPDPYIHVGVDFDSPRTRAEGTVGVSIRVGTVLAVILGVGIPALRWFLRVQKRNKEAQPPADAPSGGGRAHTAA